MTEHKKTEANSAETTIKKTDQNKAALTIQSFFFNKHRNYTGIEFDQDLKNLQQAQQKEIAGGNFDTIVNRCLKFCRLRQNKFLLNKIAFALFSGITLRDKETNSKPFFKYIKILKHLFYTDCKDVDLISRVVEDAYMAWKEECKQTSPTRKNVVSYDKEHTCMYLRESLRSLMKNATRDNFITLFTAPSKPVDGPISLEDLLDVEENQDYAHKILHLLKKYLPESSEVLKSFTNITIKIDNLLQKEDVSQQELNELKKEILTIWNSTYKYVSSENNDFGTVPLTTPSFDSRAPELKYSHGGGLLFFSNFLLGKNKGYKTDQEEGGLGMYVAPSQEATSATRNNDGYDDKYYAERAAAAHFDIPISATFSINPQYLQSTERHNYEAILPHTQRDKVNLERIEELKYKNSPVTLREEDINIYANDRNFFQQLHATIFAEPKAEEERAKDYHQAASHPCS